MLKNTCNTAEIHENGALQEPNLNCFTLSNINSFLTLLEGEFK